MTAARSRGRDQLPPRPYSGEGPLSGLWRVRPGVKGVWNRGAGRGGPGKTEGTGRDGAFSGARTVRKGRGPFPGRAAGGSEGERPVAQVRARRPPP